MNRSLERFGHEERVDHRSHADRGLDEQPTIHEGVVACAMEKKGIVSDRCELNRQIKADNALLRELKTLVKKLIDAVKNTVPAIAEAMETVRQKMIIFRYQLLHIGAGKEKLADTLQIVKPDLRSYENIVRQLKGKIRERRILLEEKKTIPAIQVFQHRELAQRIAGLTEDIEELKSEKALLLNQLNCTGDHGMDEIKQHIASMESLLKTLNQQEKKYTVELDAALAQYTELQQQAADMDTAELDTARHAIRADKEIEAVQQLQDRCGGEYNSRKMHQSQEDVAVTLGESQQHQSIRQQLRQHYQTQLHARKQWHQEQER